MLRGNRICIICCYFGGFPEYFRLFLETCRANEGFDWLIVTDDRTPFDYPQNVRVLYTTLGDLEELIRQKIGDWCVLPRAYKLCDYKPAYGRIFEDHLKDFDFWGYGDIDVLYGELSSFITPDLLAKYDKIFPQGHLSILRNTPEITGAFSIETVGTASYKAVYRSNGSFYFDESRGINEKLVQAGYSVYSGVDFLDISTGGYHRLRLIDKKIIREVLPHAMRFGSDMPKNRRIQAFALQDGKVKHLFWKKWTLQSDAYAYIHFRHRFSAPAELPRDLLIGKDGFSPLPGHIGRADLVRCNSSVLPDGLYFARFCFIRHIRRAWVQAKERMIACIGASERLHSLARKVKKKVVKIKSAKDT